MNPRWDESEFVFCDLQAAARYIRRDNPTAARAPRTALSLTPNFSWVFRGQGEEATASAVSVSRRFALPGRDFAWNGRRNPLKRLDRSSRRRPPN